jgi:hypothetical protein
MSNFAVSFKSVWVQTAAPIGPGDPGAAEPAFYFVSDGVLNLCDEHGAPTRQTHELNRMRIRAALRGD